MKLGTLAPVISIFFSAHIFAWHLYPSRKPIHISAAPYLKLRPDSNLNFDNTVIDQQIDLFINSVFENTYKSIESLNPDSAVHADCIKNALNSLLPRCLGLEASFTLTDDERRQYSIALSVCQFKATFMEYPSVCDNSLDKDSRPCVQKLHLNSQWWTTFNGYYQSVGSLCLEQKNSFQRDKILSLYQDMTTVQENLLHSVKTAHAELHKQNGEVSHTLELLKRLKEELAESAKKASVEMEGALTKMSTDASTAMEVELHGVVDTMSTVLLKKVGELLHVVEQSLEVSNKNILTLVNEVAFKLDLEMDSFKTGMTAILDGVDNQMSSIVQEAKHIEDTHQHINILQLELETQIETSIDLMQSSFSSIIGNLTEQAQNLTLTLSQLSLSSILTPFWNLSHFSPKVVLLCLLATGLITGIRFRTWCSVLLVIGLGISSNKMSSPSEVLHSYFVASSTVKEMKVIAIITMLVAFFFLVYKSISGRPESKNHIHITQARLSRNERLTEVYRILNSQ